MAKEFIRFIIVGISNTMVGVILIFLFYNILGLGYWPSTGLGYFIGSVWAYIASRYFVFQYNKKESKAIIRFVLNVVICYFIAYLIAKPMAVKICSIVKPQLSFEIKERIAIIIGMGIYTVLNFIGQKFVCFRKVDH